MERSLSCKWFQIFFPATGQDVDDDFTLTVPFVATFTVGSLNGATINVPVMILNDDVVEGPETLTVVLSDVASDATADPGTTVVDVTITDNDGEEF